MYKDGKGNCGDPSLASAKAYSRAKATATKPRPQPAVKAETAEVEEEWRQATWDEDAAMDASQLYPLPYESHRQECSYCHLHHSPHLQVLVDHLFIVGIRVAATHNMPSEQYGEPVPRSHALIVLLHAGLVRHQEPSTKLSGWMDVTWELQNQL